VAKSFSNENILVPLIVVMSTVLFFVRVNQVLVRLWARCGRKSDRMWSVSREGFSWGTGSSRDRGNVFRGVCCVLSQDDPVRDRSWARALGIGRMLSLTTGD
jgi:hypothetical protein